MKKSFLYISVFLTGASVMLVELTASRLLAPYFGTSLYVWTNVIGIILVALSLGYWAGGRIAENTKSPALLYKIIFGAGLLVALIPFAVRPFSHLTTGSLLGVDAGGALVILLGSFFVLIVLFAAPIFLLGMVSPYLIRLLTLEEKEVGAIAGRVFAIGTAGSILGTFLPVLVLVPALGSRRTILLAAATLLLLGIAGMAQRRVLLTMLVVPVLVTGFLYPGVLRARPGLIEEKESAYQYIVIEHDPIYGKILRFNEGLAIQSAELGVDGKTGTYWDYVAPVLGATKERVGERREALLIGLAGGTIAHHMAIHWGDALHITGVEIDPEVVSLARKHFSLDTIKNLSIRIEDGRTALARDEKKYDLILADAFTNQLYIPPHMATVEFFTLARERLAPGGALVVNGAAYSESSMLYRRLMRSIQEAFPYVSRYPIPGMWNFVIVASMDPIDWKKLPSQVPEGIRYVAEDLATGMHPAPSETVEPLTDDRAPVELLTDAQVFEILSQ